MISKISPMIKKIIAIVLLIISFVFFYKINDINYQKHNEIKQILIDHPDKLPKKEAAIATSFGFQNLKADYYRLKAVQYIGGNAYHSEYKEYLFGILDLITTLNPYFESPYVIGLLLLPSYEARYESLSLEEQKLHIDEAINLGLKGVNNFCDMETAEAIIQEDDLLKIWNNKEFRNPCTSYKIPYYLAYVYYFYGNDGISSSNYYKIASACEDAPEGAKTMSAIMQGKGGDREKAFYMFLNLASIMEEDEVCSFFESELNKLAPSIFEGSANLDTTIRNINTLREEAFGFDVDDSIMQDTLCSNYINKAVRELNLYYVEKSYNDNIEETKDVIYTAKELYDNGYMEYFPEDFQQYEDYGVIYILNQNTGYFDYMMGVY